MKKGWILSGLLAFGCSSAFAQTLFTYGGYPVSKEEFLQVYEKNSLNKKPDYSDKAVKEYLDLYARFRMKVSEAEKLHLDTVNAIATELQGYRKQLAQNYMTDKKGIETLVNEAYTRLGKEIRVAHILVKTAQYASPEDSLRAWTKINNVYDLITKKKQSFEQLAKDSSDDKGSSANGGEIGYITALQTIYPFENVAYATPKGKMSKPFRTQFGYHIIKVIDERPSRGEVKVAQILISTPAADGEAAVQAGKLRADSVMAQLKAGADFGELAKKYSDDRFTKDEGGVIPPFGVGKMTPAFEDAAFALTKPGELSGPLKTEYGFHIIKLIAKEPLKPLDSVRSTLTRAVERDYRSVLARETYTNNLKKTYGFKEFPENYKKLSIMIPESALQTAAFDNIKKDKSPLFILQGKTFTAADYGNFAASMTGNRISGPKLSVMDNLYKMFTEKELYGLEEKQLDTKYPEFKALMKEYRDGIMLFELMDRNVWSKASKDSAGLEKFYETNKDKYMWGPSVTGDLYKAKNQKAADALTKALKKKNITSEEVLKAVNTEKEPDLVTLELGRFMLDRFSDAFKTQITSGGVTKASPNDDGSFTVLKADKLYKEPTFKTLAEARGFVIADYQEYLDKTWNDSLKAEYPVTVNQNVLQTIIRQ